MASPPITQCGCRGGSARSRQPNPDSRENQRNPTTRITAVAQQPRGVFASRKCPRYCQQVIPAHRVRRGAHAVIAAPTSWVAAGESDGMAHDARRTRPEWLAKRQRSSRTPSANPLARPAQRASDWRRRRPNGLAAHVTHLNPGAQFRLTRLRLAGRRGERPARRWLSHMASSSR